MALFEQVKPQLLGDIRKLSNKHGLTIYNKVLKEKDMANLKSILTEAHFGLFFDQYCDQLRYDQKIFPNSKRTPDWAFYANDQIVVAEVCRINPAEEDQIIHDAETAAIEKFQKVNPGVPVIGNYHSITQKPLKLKGNSGALAVKTEKYGKLIEKNNCPFLICLYFDFISGHDKLDLFTCLYGHSVEFGGYIPHPDFPLGTTYHDLTEGMFYCNEAMKRNVSGVILKTDADYIYFHNYSSENRLNDKNKRWLLNKSLDYFDY